MTILEGSYYDSGAAAKFLGVSGMTLNRLIGRGLLTPVKVGPSNLFSEKNLREVQRAEYRDGYSHTDIARMYGVGRTLVIHHFQRLGVKPAGQDGRRKGKPTIYDLPTIQKAAAVLGWKPVSAGSQTNGSSTPAHADAAER